VLAAGVIAFSCSEEGREVRQPFLTDRYCACSGEFVLV
jgi:hypothetical protein